ncbi:hypothetical protein BDF19DRAFT_114888 [Syncephalis fuscata]|nr:hypothetical protein BDF19DRAFT_114888 [Syncephalis fuscata]
MHNDMTFFGPLADFSKIVGHRTQSPSKLKVNTQTNQSNEHPRRHSDAGLAHRSQLTAEIIPATVAEEGELTVSPCAPSAPVERTMDWSDYALANHTPKPAKIKTAIRQRSMGDFKAAKELPNEVEVRLVLDRINRPSTSNTQHIASHGRAASHGRVALPVTNPPKLRDALVAGASPQIVHQTHSGHHITLSNNNGTSSSNNSRAALRQGLVAPTTTIFNSSPHTAGEQQPYREIGGDVSPLMGALPAPVPGAWTTRTPQPSSPSRDASVAAAQASSVLKLPAAITRPSNDGIDKPQVPGTITATASTKVSDIPAIDAPQHNSKSKETVYYGKNIAKQVKIRHVNVQLPMLNMQVLDKPAKPSEFQFPIRATEAGPQAFMRRQPTLRSVRSDESLVSRITPTNSMDNGSRDNMLGWSAHPDSLGAQGPPMATLNSGMFCTQTVRVPSIRRTPSTSKPNSLWAKKPKHLQATRVLSSSPEPMPGQQRLLSQQIAQAEH